MFYLALSNLFEYICYGSMVHNQFVYSYSAEIDYRLTHTKS